MTEPKEEKCEACCGSGYINFWTDDGHISMRTCRRCDGYGYIKAKPMTNEEWLRSATTEELADVIADFYLWGFTHGHNKMDITSRTKWVEWLKKPHTNE